MKQLHPQARAVTHSPAKGQAGFQTLKSRFSLVRLIRTSLRRSVGIFSGRNLILLLASVSVASTIGFVFVWCSTTPEALLPERYAALELAARTVAAKLDHYHDQKADSILILLSDDELFPLLLELEVAAEQLSKKCGWASRVFTSRAKRNREQAILQSALNELAAINQAESEYWGEFAAELKTRTSRLEQATKALMQMYAFRSSFEKLHRSGHTAEGESESDFRNAFELQLRTATDALEALHQWLDLDSSGQNHMSSRTFSNSTGVSNV